MAISPFSFILGAAAGAAAAYFLDPRSGEQRREQAGGAVQTVKEAAPVGGGGDSEPNEPTLAHRVESEIFRADDAPKGRVSVNAEGDVVYLRGELDDQAQIEALVKAAEQVDGVERVESLLHTPGTPAPTKA